MEPLSLELVALLVALRIIIARQAWISALSGALSSTYLHAQLISTGGAPYWYSVQIAIDPSATD